MKSYSSKWKLSKAYKELFGELSNKTKYECRTVYEHYVVHNGIGAEDKITVVLRIDVDNGFHLSVPLTKYMNSYGLKASHYFLTHPDRYYDIWNSEIPKEVHSLGHEVGLHTDHYFEQLEYGTDGLSNLKDDIKRLSMLTGESIKGMVYHGHPGMNSKGITNWELTKDLESSELGLKYHDGFKSCYIDPKSEKWKPRCDFIVSDFLGIPNSWGWNYWKSYPIKQLRKFSKKNSICHLTFHTKNAFSNYWEDWDYQYNEKFFPKERLIVFYKKKLNIYINYLILPIILIVIKKMKIKN